MNNKIGNWTILDTPPIRTKKKSGSTLSYNAKCVCGTTRKVTKHNIKQLSEILTSTGFCGCRKCTEKHVRALKPNYTQFNGIYADYKHKASARSTVNEFALTKEDAYKLFIGNCNYCGCKPSNVYVNKRNKYSQIYYSGIDRVDSSKGYTVDNTVSCCKQCNYAKLTMTEAEFYDWITRVYLFKVQRSTVSTV